MLAFCQLTPNCSNCFPMDFFISQLIALSNQVFARNGPLLSPNHFKLRLLPQTSSPLILSVSTRMSVPVSLISVSIPPFQLLHFAAVLTRFQSAIVVTSLWLLR